MRACGELHRAAIVAGLCSCSRVSGSGSGTSSSGSGSSGSWNLSLECLQGRNIAECSFGLEIRNPRSNSLASSRRRGNLRDVSAPSSFTINGTGRISRKDEGQDVHLLKKIRDLQSLALQGAAQWKIVPASKSLPTNVFLGVLALVVIVGMLKLREFVPFGRRSPESGVKSRIQRSEWFKESRSSNGKRKLDEALLRPSKNFKAEEADFPVFERLVIHDGEVIRGGSNNSKLEPGSRRKISLAPRNTGGQGVKSSTLADANRLSRIRNFLSRTNDHNARPLFQNSKKTSAEEAIKEQAGETHVQRNWNDKDELDLRKRIEDLRQSVQAAEYNRKAAIQALVQERKRSLELEVKIRRQKEAATALEEEVRVLKESHEALLASLRKKYSSSAAARAAAALLYQNWESGETSNV
ncbi:hypothetical protein SELMODRAFT_410013 [Selaginella moellendorffii]|uniref:Uncharacterized protein n=1 Tax=Selaginella moellendorffii TaxID=88036 RepID=D8RD69_SELML|nr:uncharacterized protein LOC9658911 [Selaginella moellendorffii]EFJ29968.1 hypothetical protein SELMODRAFT_410013 [Selaginella moellendorffii]|eukprot:XP_002968852.1 uncharacterized protein LOC9658911 [Selaginella moellendorffii]